MKAEVVAVSATYLDLNAKNFPANRIQIGEEIIGRDYEVKPGGSGLNFVRASNSMGLSAMYIGAIGADEMGDTVIALSKRDSLPATFIKKEGAQTNIGVNFMTQEGGQAMTVIGTANELLTGEDLQNGIESSIDTLKYLYLGSCFKLTGLLESFESLAQDARKRGVQTVLDHGRVDEKKVKESDMDLMKRVVPQVDFYLPSKAEYQRVWRAGSIESGQAVFEYMKTTIVVKDEANGVFGFKNGEMIHVPAFKVENPEYTVGAGDAFNAGFLIATKEGKTFEEAIRFGCATAAVKIQQPTSPTRLEVDTFLAKNG